jgi:hypothetical protein
MATYPEYADTTYETSVDQDVDRMQAMLDTELRVLGQLRAELPVAEAPGCRVDTSFMFGESTATWARDRFRAMIESANTFSSSNNPHNVAVLVFGSERLSPQTATSFERHVYRILDRPAVFAYLAHEPSVPEKWVSQRRLWHDMATRYVVGPNYNYTSGMTGYSPCLDWEYPTGSIWNGGWPNSSRPDIANMHQYYGTFQAGEMMRADETKRGRAYDWVIITRADHVHHAPHPIPGFLNRSYVYLPSGSDWNGYNDRHGIFPRAMANSRIDFHKTLMDGTYHCPFPPKTEHINMERTFRELFAHNNVPSNRIARYTATSVLGCTQPVCPPERNTSKYVDEGARRDRNLNDSRIARRWEIIEHQSMLWNVYRRDCAGPAVSMVQRPQSPQPLSQTAIHKLSRQLVFSTSLMAFAVVAVVLLLHVARRWQIRAVLTRRILRQQRNNHKFTQTPSASKDERM